MGGQAKKKLDLILLLVSPSAASTRVVRSFIMAESGSPQSAGAITSSADRMVGMEHAEVRYFTRYVEASRELSLIVQMLITAP